MKGYCPRCKVHTKITKKELDSISFIPDVIEVDDYGEPYLWTGFEEFVFSCRKCNGIVNVICE